MTTETTDQGEQIVLPGAERSARQAAAARGAKMRPKRAQRELEERVQLLRRIGEALYGERWQSDLARDLAVHPRTMRYLMSGGWTIQDWVLARCKTLIGERLDGLQGLAEELEGY
jgi:hypothetical protein